MSQQIVKTHIRQLLKKQSDQGLYYLPITVLNMLDQIIIIEPRHVISNMFQHVAF